MEKDSSPWEYYYRKFRQVKMRNNILNKGIFKHLQRGAFKINMEQYLRGSKKDKGLGYLLADLTQSV